MFPISTFIKENIIAIENGAHFTPRLTHSRPLWTYFPTKRFPFFTLEVEEDIFPFYADKNVTIFAEGVRIDNNQKVKGYLIRRPMIYFAVATQSAEHWICPLFYWSCEIFNQNGKFTIHRDNFTIIKAVDIYDRIIRNYHLPGF